jgi:hypothetical protein
MTEGAAIGSGTGVGVGASGGTVEAWASDDDGGLDMVELLQCDFYVRLLFNDDDDGLKWVCLMSSSSRVGLGLEGSGKQGRRRDGRLRNFCFFLHHTMNERGEHDKDPRNGSKGMDNLPKLSFHHQYIAKL